MISLAIGSVESLTGISPHVLRYWESIVPIISPVKDISGHRKYNARNIDFIFRLKFLTQKKGCTIQQATNQMLCETSNSETLRTSLDISLLRSDLIELYFALQEKKNATR